MDLLEGYTPRVLGLRDYQRDSLLATFSSWGIPVISTSSHAGVTYLQQIARFNPGAVVATACEYGILRSEEKAVELSTSGLTLSAINIGVNGEIMGGVLDEIFPYPYPDGTFNIATLNGQVVYVDYLLGITDLADMFNNKSLYRCMERINYPKTLGYVPSFQTIVVDSLY